MNNGKYIPFSALSALAAKGTTLYSVDDSYYMSSCIFTIDTTTTPYTITKAMRVLDSNGALAAALPEEMAEAFVNDDQTVNLDQEGIDVIDGGFWICSEGAGTGDAPESLNLLVRVDSAGVIQEVVTLPDEVNAIQIGSGFEGVAVDGDYLVVTFQRAWGDEAEPRLGIYNTETSMWKFVFYPLDPVESQNGGWVGLSDIASLGDGKFLILERDNQGGLDAAIKKLYEVDLGDYSMEDGMVVSKTLVRDLMPDLSTYGKFVMEKIEGVAVDGNGNVWINNDNDGVENNSGEQLLLNLGKIV